MPLKDFEYWIDANLPPVAAEWLSAEFAVSATHIYSMIGLLASDNAFFEAAKAAGRAVIITKDKDFAQLVAQKGPPPHIMLVKAGNLSNAVLKLLLLESLPAVVSRFETIKQPLIQIP